MEGEQFEEQRNVGESSCNSGDGTDQSVQSLIFMMMTMMMILRISFDSQNTQSLLPKKATTLQA